MIQLDAGPNIHKHPGYVNTMALFSIKSHSPDPGGGIGVSQSIGNIEPTPWDAVA